MATKKEKLIDSLKEKGFAPETYEGMTVTQMEKLIADMGDSAIDVEATLEDNDEVVIVEEPKVTIEAQKETSEVVAEFTQQLSIFSKLIYNRRNEGATLVVENLGYGDVYVSDKADVLVGNESQRLLFKEIREFNSDKLFLTSASQPVVSIIEVK